jgi:hypothetical protein
MRATERLCGRVRNRHRPVINPPTRRRTVLEIVIPSRRRARARRRREWNLGGRRLGRGRRYRGHDDVPHQNDEGGRDQRKEQGLHPTGPQHRQGVARETAKTAALRSPAWGLASRFLTGAWRVRVARDEQIRDGADRRGHGQGEYPKRTRDAAVR